MVKACEENHVIFMAGHIMNFFNGVHHAKELINDGVIGKVLYCHSARNGWEDVQTSVSWKKIREKSGGHLYHHIHELDCVQFIMGGMPETVYMNADNVAHRGEEFGDEDDMIFINMKFSDNRYAVLEWGSAFHWPEHYLLIQGSRGAIKLDMFDAGVTLKVDGKEVHSPPMRTRRRMPTGRRSTTGRRWTARFSTAIRISFPPVASRPDREGDEVSERYHAWDEA